MKSGEGPRKLGKAALLATAIAVGGGTIYGYGVFDTAHKERQKLEAQHGKGKKGASSELNPDRELLREMLKKEGLRNDVRVISAQLEFMRSLLESKDGITKISGDKSGEKLDRLFIEKVVNADKTAMTEDVKMSTRVAISGWFNGYKKRGGDFTEGSLRKEIAREVKLLSERIDEKQSGIRMNAPDKIGQ